MSEPKVDPSDYIDFLVASPKDFTATEAARSQSPSPEPPAHDAFTRLLHRLEPDANALWAEAEPQVRKATGVLVIDDSTLDKPYAKSIHLVTRHWSGKPAIRRTARTTRAPVSFDGLATSKCPMPGRRVNSTRSPAARAATA